MKYLLLVSIVATAALAKAETKSNESLTALMGAVSQVINDNTKIPGKNETPAKLTPPAEQTLKALNNDLDACQTSKTQEPQIVSVQKDGVSVDFKKFDLRIYGDNCPLEITANLTSTDENSDRLAATFVMKVVFKKQTYIDKYKLRFAEIQGDISAVATKEDTTVKVPVHLKMTGRGDSTELGLFNQTVDFNITIAANLAQFSFAMESEQTAILQYQDVNKKAYSHVKMNGFTQPDVLYTINDQKVSESEFQSFMQSFNMPGMISDEDPTSPDQKAPTQCSFVAYDKKAITADVLKAQMKSGQLQSNGQLVRGQSCMKNVSVPFKSPTQTYSGDILFGTEWISFNGVAANTPKLSGSVYVLYGDQSAQTSETDELVLGLQCLPAPICH